MKLEEELSDEETKEKMDKLRKELFPEPMNEKELWRQAQKDVVEICRLKAKLKKMEEEIEWWKDKLFKILDAECSNRVITFHFSKDDAKTIFEAFKKWRELHSKVSDSEVEG